MTAGAAAGTGELLKARIRTKDDWISDEPVPGIDPSEDLPPGSCLIMVSKGLATVLAIVIFFSTFFVAVWFYETLAEMLLAGENRETTQGLVEGLSEVQSHIMVQYVFQAAGREVHGTANLSKDQSAGLKVGSPIEIAYARSMPSVYKLGMLLPSSTEDAREIGHSLALPFLVIFGLWVVMWCMSSWEHVYLSIRYFVKTGGVAWNQILKVLHNAVFTMLSILLVFLMAGIAGAQTTGAYAHLWPWQAAGIAGIVVALGLLLRWTPFRRR
jgi:hypothetical protein